MSQRNSIDHHVRALERREERRMIMDVVLVMLFVLILAVGIFAHLQDQSLQRRISSEVALREVRTIEAERLLVNARAEALNREMHLKDAMLIKVADEPVTSAVWSTTEVDIRDEATVANITKDVSGGTSTATVPIENIHSYPRFQDVATTRYENSRLGFVMEIPVGWYLAYERGEDVAFGSDLYAFGVSLEDIKKPDGALWMRIVRPCASTEATSTVFAFATAADTSIREATSCIPPFLVTLGYRAGAPNTHSREEFLLSLGRTFYPMVLAYSPYSPIR